VKSCCGQRNSSGLRILLLLLTMMVLLLLPLRLETLMMWVTEEKAA
jgi:hypothetical protein